MKTTLVILMLAIATACAAQKVDSTISSKKIGLLSCEYEKTTENSIASYRVVISFQDGRYPALGLWEVITLSSQASVDSLITDLASAKLQMGNKVTWSKEAPEYSLTVNTGAKMVTIANKSGAFTNVTSAQADKFIAWLKSIKFP
jgi:hypothetical protein